MNQQNNKTFNVAAYARVSTDKEDQLNSLENQIKYFSDYITKNENWKFYKIYTDEGLSGTTIKNRTGFNTMINDAMNGKIDLILTKEVSRFARNTVDSLKYTRLLKEKNVFIIFMLDGIDTRQQDWELRLTIMSAIAQEESRKISERIKWGQKRQMEKGVVFGRSLLGYDVKNGQLYLIEKEAQIVRLIFHKYVNEKKGVSVIANELNEIGIPTKRNNLWSGAAILKILKNEKYSGDICQKKSWTKSYLDHKKLPNNGNEEKIYIKNHHSNIAIVSKSMWQLAQEEMEKRKNKALNKSKHSSKYWASGKIICACCNENFVCRKNKTSLFWCCINKTRSYKNRTCTCTMDKWVNDKSLRFIVLYVINYLIYDKTELKKAIANQIYALTGINSAEYIENILNFSNLYIDGFLSFITEKITVFRSGKIELILKDIPEIFVLEYTNKGKKDNYITQIQNFEIKK